MRKIKIDIPDLLKKTELQSIYSLAEEYGYSYATLYREVERLKNAEEREKQIKDANIRSKYQSKNANSIKVINNLDNNEYIYINVDKSFTLDKQVYICIDKEFFMLKTFRYELESISFDIEMNKNIYLGNDVFKKLLKSQSSKLCNKIIVTLENCFVMKLKDERIFFKIEAKEEVKDSSKKIIIKNLRNDKKIDIKNIIERFELKEAHRIDNVITKCRVCEINKDGFKLFINSLDIEKDDEFIIYCVN